MKEDNPIFIPLVQPNLLKRLNQCAAMHAMAAFFLLVYAIRFLATLETDWMYVVALLPAVIYILFISFFKKRTWLNPYINRNFRILESGFLLLGGITFYQTGKPGASFLYLVLAVVLLVVFYLEMRILQTQYIIIEKDRMIIEKAVRNQVVYSHQIKQRLIKGNYLTYILDNDTIYQFEINPFEINNATLHKAIRIPEETEP
jgi:hypothetical protein